MQTDKAKQFEYNLNVLKRRDSAITEILDMSGHVVLYQFNEASQSWDRKNVEGGLFVVARSSEPKHMFVVMNRLSNENVVEGITADFQMELTEQFLLYRNEKQEINGIWFYAPHERASIAELLQHLIAASPPVCDTPTACVDTSAEDAPSEPTPLQQATGEQGSANDAATSAAANGSPAFAPDATTANNVAEFFSMAQSQMQPSGTHGGSLGGSPSLLPTDAATACNVAEFFSMAQSQLPPSAVPPMPTGATDAAAANAAVTVPACAVLGHASSTGQPVPPAATAPEPPPIEEAPPTAASTFSATEATAAAPTVVSAADPMPTSAATEQVAALKRQLRVQLTSLLDDDSFMTMLAAEYLQQKSVVAPVDAASSGLDVPSHLLALLEQQRIQ